MASTNQREVWQRGPVPGIPPLLQPVAHALLQAREEVEALMQDFPAAHLWTRPAGLASPGFHLQHLTGVLDRLFTYAKEQSLNQEQLGALAQEGKPLDTDNPIKQLLTNFARQVDLALEQLSNTDEATLTAHRAIGRAQIPTTHLGLLVHAAEHTMRHVGQLLVTVRILRDGKF